MSPMQSTALSLPAREDGNAAVIVEPDEHYARGWCVDNPLAQGALKHAAMQILDELDEAPHEVQHGTPVGDTDFVQDYLPAGFIPAYDERFLECSHLFGRGGLQACTRPRHPARGAWRRSWLLRSSGVWRPTCSRSPAPASHPSTPYLRGVFEICEDDDVLDLYDMEEPADAAVHGHDQISRQMGKADMRAEAWFEPMWIGTDGATPHPACC